MEVWGQGENPVFRITKKPPSETGVKKPRYLSPFFYGFVRKKAGFTDKLYFPDFG